MKVKYAFFILLLLIAFGPSPFRTTAGMSTGEDSILDTNNRRLQEVEKEIRRFNGELESLRNRKKTIVSELMEVACRVELTRAEMTKLDLNLSACESEIYALKDRIGDLRREIEEDKRVLAKRLNRIYKMGKGGYLKSLLGTDDVQSLMFGYRYVLYVANQDIKIINETKSDMRELSERRMRLNRIQETATTLKRENTEKKSALEALLRKKENLLNRIKTDEKYHEALLDDLEKTALALEEIIVNLQDRKSQAGEKSIIYPLFSLCRENLPWPVKGRIINPFGRKKDPRFGTYTVRNGIDILCDPQTPIRAVHDGYVVFADWFENYGRLIILDHQLGYYSLYAHASRIDVSRGSFIRKDEVLGTAGDQGLLGNAYLHFEIRKKSKPLNPLEWLERKGS